MTLKQKLLAITGSTLFCAILALSFAIQQILAQNIKALEGLDTAIRAADLEKMYAQVLIAVLVAVFAAGLIFALLGYWLASRQLLERIIRLSQKAQDRAAASLSDGGDEITALENACQQAWSQRSDLEQALARMDARLRDAGQQFISATNAIDATLEELAAAAKAANGGASRALTELQHVSSAHQQQNDALSTETRRLEEICRTSAAAASQGEAQRQSAAAVSALSGQVNHAICQVSENTSSLAAGAATAAQAARDGSTAVGLTIQGMDRIRNQVAISTTHVLEMGSRSDQIGSIVETISQISSQTNLLALNAAIEAARSQAKSAQITQSLLQNHLVAVAALLAKIDEDSQTPIRNDDLANFARQARVDTLLISDPDGVITTCNEVGIAGYRFSEDPKEQSHVFRQLLTKKDGVITQPVQPRSRDGMPFMWVGVSRRKQPGIIQAGMTAEAVQRSSTYGEGFAVIAEEVRKLADQASLATKEISALIRVVQETVSKAAMAMQDSHQEVESGEKTAHQAGETLNHLLEAAQQASQQAGEVLQAANQMQATVQALDKAIGGETSYSEENLAAARKVASSLQVAAQAMGKISASGGNTQATLEKIGSANREVDRQASQILNLVQTLRKIGTGLRAFAGK